MRVMKTVYRTNCILRGEVLPPRELEPARMTWSDGGTRWPAIDLYALVFTFLLATSFVTLRAQQVEEFSLLQENAFILNPALAGTEGYLHGSASFRKEFLQITQS